LAESFADTLTDGPNDVLSESDDNVDSESYSDFEPEISRKIKKTMHHLSSDCECGTAEQQDSDDKSDMYTVVGGLQHGKKKSLFPN
jgi:hypothetical protein